MRKKQYIFELTTTKPVLQKGLSNHPDVKKVQEWLNLWSKYDPNWKMSIKLDGDFGPDTELKIKKFQEFNNLTVDGIVGGFTWRKLTQPMIEAFSLIETDDASLPDLIVKYARQHLKSRPMELGNNEGSWVRAYMDGLEGSSYPWCMGFVQTVIDQATHSLSQDLKDYMPLTYSCDVVGEHGLNNGKLIRNADIRKEIANGGSPVKPGDIFLNVKAPHDWTHTGIVTGVNVEIIETIEGNTNDEGSRDGYEVCARQRSLTTKNIDILQI